MFNVALFNDRFLMLRKANNLSQAQFGNIINLSRQAINEIEKGRSKLSIDKLVLLSDYFGISADYLLGRTDGIDQLYQSSLALSDDAKMLLSSYSTLSISDRKRLLDYMELLQSQKKD